MDSRLLLKKDRPTVWAQERWKQKKSIKREKNVGEFLDRKHLFGIRLKRVEETAGEKARKDEKTKSKGTGNWGKELSGRERVF